MQPRIALQALLDPDAMQALQALVLRVLDYDRGQAYAGSFQQWSNQPDTVVDR